MHNSNRHFKASIVLSINIGRIYILNKRDTRMNVNRDHMKRFLRTSSYIRHSAFAMALMMAISASMATTTREQNREEGTRRVPLQTINRYCNGINVYPRNSPSQQPGKRYLSRTMPGFTSGSSIDELTISAHSSVFGIKASRENSLSETQNEVYRLAHPLITENMNWNDRQQIIDALITISEPERRDIVIYVHTLLIGSMNYEHAGIIRALGNVPVKERASVVAYVRFLIPHGIIGNYESIIRVLGEIPEPERANIVVYARSLFTKHMVTGHARTLKAIWETPAAERADIVAYARLLSREGGLGGQEDIIKAIQEIPAKEREDVVSHAQTFLAESRDYELPGIIRILGKISAQARASVVDCVRSLIPQGIIGNHVNIIEGLLEISAEDRDSVISHAYVFLSNEIIGNPKDIIRIIGSIAVEERENVIKNLYRIIIQSKVVPYNYKILKLLRNMEQQERDTLCNQIEKYYGKINNIQFIRVFRFIPFESRDIFAHSLKSHGNLNPLTFLCSLMSENVEFKDAVFNYWHHLFLQPRKETRELSKLILGRLEELELNPTHPLAQEAQLVNISFEDTP